VGRKATRPYATKPESAEPRDSPLDLLTQLREENAWLRGQVAESRQALVAMADVKAHAQIEYWRAVDQQPPAPRSAREKEVRQAPEASVHFSSLMAEGHVDGPVHTDEEEEILRREAEREFELEMGKGEG
jgi:hypothetical protein